MNDNNVDIFNGMKSPYVDYDTNDNSTDNNNDNSTDNDGNNDNSTDNNNNDSSSMVQGGVVKLTGSGILKYAIVGVMILLVVYIFYRIYVVLKYKGEDYYQRKTHYYFDNIHGDTFDNEAKLAIEYGESIPEPRAIDHYRLGTVYLINAKQPQAAHNHFRQALEHVINGNVNTREANFIIDRIDDYKYMFVDHADIEEDLPVQEALLAQYNQMANVLGSVKKTKKKEKIKSNDPEFTQKILLSRKNWESDSQNVHDSAIYKELHDQVSHTLKENKKNKEREKYNYASLCSWLQMKYAKDITKLNKINQVLSFFSHNYSISSLPGVNEQDIIVGVWQRAHDPRNKKNSQRIRNALGENILDCVEGNNVVCTAGRTAKIWSSLAKLDYRDDIGILKTKQSLRNEIYDKSAKIVNDYFGDNGSASKDLKQAYQKSENTEQVNELIECIKGEIDELRDEYSGLLPSDQLALVIEECKSIV